MVSPGEDTADLESGMAIEAKEATAAVSSSSHDSLTEEAKIKSSQSVKEEQGTTKQISGRWKTILGQGALVTILMCGMAASMLVLTLIFELESLKIGSFPSNDYIIIRDIPASAVVCIASLASLLSIILFRSFLKLCSFPLAHDLLIHTERGDRGNLPSPRDFSTILRTLTGSPHAYIQALRRSFHKGTHGKLVLRQATIAYSYAILFSALIICCSFCICAYTRGLRMPSTYAVANGATNYGRALVHDCLQSSGTGICQTRMDLHAGNNSDNLLTVKGLSDQNKIVRLDFQGLSEFHNESLMILADPRASKGSSFTAKTYGVSTYFKDIGSECEVTAQSWNCSDHHFDGNFSIPLTIPQSKNMLIDGNDVMWVLAAKVQVSEGMFKHVANGSDFGIDPMSNFLSTVMHCETSVWEVEYLKLGEEYIPQTIKTADPAAAKLIFGPAFPGLIAGYEGFDLKDLVTEFNARALQSNTTEQLAHNWAESFAKLAISSSAGIMEQVPVTQQFSTITAVPRSWFMVLGFSVFLYGLLGLAIMLAAIRAVTSRPEVREVQAQMGIFGLVSAALEPRRSGEGASSVEELLGNDSRVGIYKTASGGYKWEARNSNRG
ncbi:hypothetical protein BLS_008840 [Venturia inaequalis]|uniref:Uncharacterized protein n=1 Tax=Venturia inaequalis TaxID=5025 RepID=A0A8H3Z3Q4_VENIN|nr:hypothetical protein BLS_008840 [Venturia inaequalis]KAE9984144.1 hypothetical protein EG327_005225 [Venturia inaequalis]RDI82657.1 hypothetical protein Vi05172_g7429 [Venturia inaequalis]